MREQFGQSLGEMGWRVQAQPDEDGGKVYVGRGRELHLGYDLGMHPTTLVLRYQKFEQEPKTQPSGGSGPGGA